MVMKIPFFRLGEWKHPVYGPIRGTKEMFSKMIENFKNKVIGQEPFIRIGHDKSSSTTFGDAPALAWVKDIVEENGVLYGLAEPTTQEAAEMVRTGQYRFASAEYTPNYVSKETGESMGPALTAIALTNEPFLTKLPEAQVLSDQPDLFMMDFALAEPSKKEEEGKMNEMLQKLSDMFNGFMKKSDETQAEMKTKLSSMEEQLKLADKRAQQAEEARKLAEVDKEAADMVAQGIPPVMVQQWKALSLSETSQTMVKLADGKEVSNADAMKQMLLAMPKENRIPMGQVGSAGAPPTTEEQAKLAANEDIVALGGKVTDDGKFEI